MIDITINNMWIASATRYFVIPCCGAHLVSSGHLPSARNIQSLSNNAFDIVKMLNLIEISSGIRTQFKKSQIGIYNE